MTTSSSEAHALPLLPVPDIPSTAHRPVGSVAFTSGHHFALVDHDDPRILAESATAPLSVIVQVTKRCDFGCVFCSETLQMPDPRWTQLDTIRANLAGVQRVFLSGGEPLLRRDLPEIVDMYSEFILGLPTNATRGVAMAARGWPGRSRSSTSASTGPRATFTRVRGDYDKAMSRGPGVRRRRAADLAVRGRAALHLARAAVPVPDRRRARRGQAQADPAAAQGQRARAWPSVNSSPSTRPATRSSG